MPKKRDIAPATDRSEFVSRLIDCVGGPTASKRDFALRAGILPSTFNNYFKAVEPPRDTLIKIARTANVSVGWLVDGSEERSAAGGARLVSMSDAELSQFRRNLTFIMGKPRLLVSVPKRTGIPDDRLRALCRNELPTRDEMERLSSVWPEQVLKNLDIAGFEEESGFRMLPAKVGDLPLSELSRGDPSNAVHRVGLLIDEIVALVGDRNVHWVTAKDDLMAPTIPQESIAVAIRRDHITGSGLYVFKNEAREFLARVTITSDERAMLSYDNPKHERISYVELDPARFKCVGPIAGVILKVTKPAAT